MPTVRHLVRKKHLTPLTSSKFASLRLLNDWADEWAQANDSAINIWGTESQLRRVKEAVDAGLKVISVSTCTDDNDDADDEEGFTARDKMDAELEVYKKVGFRVLAWEDNHDQSDAVVAGTQEQFRQMSKGKVRAALEHSAKRTVATLLES